MQLHILQLRHLTQPKVRLLLMQLVTQLRQHFLHLIPQQQLSIHLGQQILRQHLIRVKVRLLLTQLANLLRQHFLLLVRQQHLTIQATQQRLHFQLHILQLQHFLQITRQQQHLLHLTAQILLRHLEHLILPLRRFQLIILQPQHFQLHKAPQLPIILVTQLPRPSTLRG